MENWSKTYSRTWGQVHLVVVDQLERWQSSHYNQHEHWNTEPTYFPSKNLFWVDWDFYRLTWEVDKIFLWKIFRISPSPFLIKPYYGTNDLENLFISDPTVYARTGRAECRFDFLTKIGLERRHHQLVWKITTLVTSCPIPPFTHTTDPVPRSLVHRSWKSIQFYFQKNVRKKRATCLISLVHRIIHV